MEPLPSGPMLRALRERRDAPLDHIAWVAGLSRGYLRQVEQGQRRPTVQVLNAYACVLGIEEINRWGQR